MPCARIFFLGFSPIFSRAACTEAPSMIESGRAKHIFKQARRQLALFGALAAVQLAGEGDVHRFARRHIAHQGKAGTVQRHRFEASMYSPASLRPSTSGRMPHGSRKATRPRRRQSAPPRRKRPWRGDARRPRPLKIASDRQLGAFDIVFQLVGKHIQQHFRIGLVLMAQVFFEHRAAERLVLVRLVIAPARCKRRIDIKRRAPR